MVRFSVVKKCGGKWGRNVMKCGAAVKKITHQMMSSREKCEKGGSWWEKCERIYTKNLFNYIFGVGSFAGFAHRTTTITNFKEYTLRKGGI